MQYNVVKTQQVAVEAESSDEAVQKVSAGQGVVVNSSYNASPRPNPSQAQRPGGQGG